LNNNYVWYTALLCEIFSEDLGSVSSFVTRGFGLSTFSAELRKSRVLDDNHAFVQRKRGASDIVWAMANRWRVSAFSITSYI